MTNVSVSLDDKTIAGLDEIARRYGCSMEQCIAEAIAEYVAGCQDEYHTDFNAVSAMERSFFLSAGE